MRANHSFNTSYQTCLDSYASSVPFDIASSKKILCLKSYTPVAAERGLVDSQLLPDGAADGAATEFRRTDGAEARAR